VTIYRDPPRSEEPAPCVLVCSGLDPSGGAGFIADVRVVQTLGGRPVGAITANTVQNTTGLRSIHEVDADVLDAQLSALLTDVEIKGIKLGMLGGPDIVRVLDDAFSMTDAPLVWDPIAAPTRGGVVVSRDALDSVLPKLAAHLTLITPNAMELSLLAGAKVRTLDEAVAGAQAFASLSGVAVLVKGGHLEGMERDEVVDVLAYEDKLEYFRGPRHEGPSVHGTGCALSSAIATYLALRYPLVEACRAAKIFVAELIARPALPGRGAPAIL